MHIMIMHFAGRDGTSRGYSRVLQAEWSSCNIPL
jgi:hypothetical protein